jgi:hypothetical protein
VDKLFWLAIITLGVLIRHTFQTHGDAHDEDVEKWTIDCWSRQTAEYEERTWFAA